MKKVSVDHRYYDKLKVERHVCSNCQEVVDGFSITKTTIGQLCAKCFLDGKYRSEHKRKKAKGKNEKSTDNRPRRSSIFRTNRTRKY